MVAGEIQAGITAALEAALSVLTSSPSKARRYASSIPAGGSGPDRHSGAHDEVSVQRVVSLTPTS